MKNYTVKIEVTLSGWTGSSVYSMNQLVEEGVREAFGVEATRIEVDEEEGN